MTLVRMLLVATLMAGLGPPIGAGEASTDIGWEIVYQENFDSAFAAVDGQTFGEDDWLIFQLLNGGAITVANGYAQLNAPDFWNAALIRSTHILPAEYKIRTRIGYINYDLGNYEQADDDDPDFNDHGGFFENGMYFLTVTNDTCVGDECAEYWWHYHRKMVIDVDNHMNASRPPTFHPVFMVFMAPEVNSGGNLLRSWDGVVWDSSSWNWNVAYTYEYDTWYYAELEKRDGHITLRLYDDSLNVIEAPPPVPFSAVFAMNDTTEYLYVGEPHTDDYEGDVRIDEITLFAYREACCMPPTVGDINQSGAVDITDVQVLVDNQFLTLSPLVCDEEADIDFSGVVDITDLQSLIDSQFITLLPLPPCP